MSRPLRLDHAGAFWHVTARGNERREIFRDDADRREFLAVLARTVSLFRWRLHAYVLMDNHYHLGFETPEPTLSRGMKQLNGLYTQRFNRRHGRCGHLFQGRFHAVLVQKDAHFLELMRYIVLNPVRGGLSRSASAWPWSSFRATSGLEREPEWLDVQTTRACFASSRVRACAGYRAFVQQGRNAGYEPWDLVRGQIFLGNESFRAKAVSRAAGTPVSREVPRAQRSRAASAEPGAIERAAGATLEEMRSRPRAFVRQRRRAAAYLRHEALLSFSEIGRILGVGAWQASHLASAGE